MVLYKRIAIVGNADTCHDMGSYIDSFDVVVRINNGWNIPEHMKEHIGSRCDLIFTHVNYLKQYGIKDTNKPFRKINILIRNSLTKHFGGVPSSGIMAVYEMLKENPALLFVTGISFFKEPYRNNLANTPLCHCEINRQTLLKGLYAHKSGVDYNIFNVLYQKNKNVIQLDEYLTNIFKPCQNQ